MKYKVTLEIKGKYELELEAVDLGKAAAKAEQIFANKKDYNDIADLTGQAIRVERTLS